MGKIFWLVVVFLLVGAYMIKTTQDYNFDDSSDKKSFVVTFGKWVWQVGNNVVGLVGYAADQEWLPVINETNSTDDVLADIPDNPE